MTNKSVIVGITLACLLLGGCVDGVRIQEVETSIQRETEVMDDATRKQAAIVLAINDLNARLDALPDDEPARMVLEAQVAALEEATDRLAGVIDAQNTTIGTQTAELELLKAAQDDPLGTVLDAAAPFVPAPWRELLAGVLGIIGVVQTVRQRNAKAEANIHATNAEAIEQERRQAREAATVFAEDGKAARERFDRLVNNVEMSRDNSTGRMLSFKVLKGLNIAAGIQDLVTKARPAKPAA